ncbi:hypothetical protein SLA2020_287230 [Shorea laevis]
MIMNCVCTTSTSICVNGSLSNEFLPSRGIRQGDPISPYIFILCMEYLSLLIEKECQQGSWTPIKASRRGPLFSHILFADDILLFSKATNLSTNAIKNTLELFCSTSSLSINLQKSKILFSPNVNHLVQDRICSTLGIQVTSYIGKYLGIPLFSKRPTKKAFDFILDRAKKKLVGWKAKLLTLTGRMTLINSTLRSLPIHAMQCCLLPASIPKTLDKLTRDFL